MSVKPQWLAEGRLKRDMMGRPVVVMAYCPECNRYWNNALISARTPVAPGTCPYDHDDQTLDNRGVAL